MAAIPHTTSTDALVAAEDNNDSGGSVEDDDLAAADRAAVWRPSLFLSSAPHATALGYQTTKANDDDDDDDDDDPEGHLTDSDGEDNELPTCGERLAAAKAEDYAKLLRFAGAAKAFLLRGEVTLVICTMIYAVQALIAKVLERTVPSMAVVLFRSVVAGAMTARTSVGVAKARRATESPEDRPSWFDEVFGDRSVRHLGVMRGVFGSVSFAIFYATYPLLTIAEHVSLQFLFPIFLIGLAWPILGEKPLQLDALAVSLGAVGTILVVRPGFIFTGDEKARSENSEDGRNLGIILNIVGAVIMAAVMLTIRLAKDRVSALQLSAWFHGFSIGVGGLSLLVGMQPAPTLPPTLSELGLLVLISCTSFAANITLNYSFQQLPAARAAGLNYIQIVWGFLLDALVLQEPVTWSAAVGALLISGGGMMVKCAREADPETCGDLGRWLVSEGSSSSSSSSSSSTRGARALAAVVAGGLSSDDDAEDGTGSSGGLELAARALVGGRKVTEGPLYVIAGGEEDSPTDENDEYDYDGSSYDEEEGNGIEGEKDGDEDEDTQLRLQRQHDGSERRRIDVI